MSVKPPRQPPANPSKEDRLAKALRDNLARRKALQRTKRSRDADTPPDQGSVRDQRTPDGEDEAPS